MEANDSSPPTDSPWFWLLVFSLMALAALVAIGPKYSRRQAALERNYQARERVAERVAAGEEVHRPSRDVPADQRAFASADERLIPLWPLAVIVVVIAILSSVMLYRDHRNHRGRGRPGSREEESAAP